MFRDAKEELQRLEQELLEVEAQETEEQQEPEWEEEPSEEEGESYVNFPENIRAYNTDHTDVDLEEFSRQVREPEKPIAGWVVLAFLLMTGIVCVLGYWVLRYLGVLG